MTAPATTSRLAFGLFEVDLQTGEMWKAGRRIKLQSQPFKVLTALLEKPGQIVSREELQHRLWGKDTIVDFDHSLGTAINKIREALNDSAENPRFVETLSRRGYRFIAPVGHVAQPEVGHVVLPEVDGSLYMGDPAIDPTSTLHSLHADRGHHPGTAAETAAYGGTSSVLPDQKRVPHRQPTRTETGFDSTAAAVAGVRGAGHANRIAVSLQVIAVGALLVCAAAGAAYWAGLGQATVTPPHIAQITQNGHLAAGAEHMEDLAESATDGLHLYSTTIEAGQSRLVAVSLAGGSVVPIPTPDEVASPALGDLSPDNSKLLLRNHLSPASEQPLWVVPTIGGSALRVGSVLAHDAAWMPDGTGILYAAGNELYVTGLTNATPRLYATLPGRAFWLRWQPSGKLLRFTLIDPVAHTRTLWQLSPDDRKPHQLLAGWNASGDECCGVWTADGSSFVFQSDHGGNSDLWRLTGRSTQPSRLTDGPLRYGAPVASRTGNRIYFLGVDARSETKRFSPATGQLEAETGALGSAVRIDYSRDGQWVAWTDDAGALWRSRADGSERLQLTPESMDVFLARWAPDGRSLAVMGREPGKAWQIYTVPAAGGSVEPLLEEGRNAADPSWSPDGGSLVFGRTNDMMGKDGGERTLQIFHLKTRQMERIPGSEGMFSPRWSPDGRYIAALSLDQKTVTLFTVATRQWQALPISSGADPIWSPDSRSLYIHSSQDPTQPIDRIWIPEGRVESIIKLGAPAHDDAVDYVLSGLAPDGRPLIRERLYTGNIYSLQLPGR